MDNIVVGYEHVGERFVIHISNCPENVVDRIVFPQDTMMEQIIEFFIIHLKHEYKISAFHNSTLPITFSRISSHVESQFNSLTIQLKRNIFDFLDDDSKSTLSCVSRQLYYDTMHIVYKKWQVVKSYPKYKLDCFKSFVCFENDFPDSAEHMIIIREYPNLLFPIETVLPQNLISLRINTQLQILKVGILPPTLTHLYISSLHRIEPGSLPESLQYIDFYRPSTISLSVLYRLYPNSPYEMFLPKSLKTLRIGCYDRGMIKPGSLPEGLERFEIYDAMYNNLYDMIDVGSIPSTVRHLLFKCVMPHEIRAGILPDGLETLVCL